MSFTYSINHNPRSYSVTDGERVFTWTAEAPHVIQPTPDDGTDEWLERAAQAAVEMFNDIKDHEDITTAREILVDAQLKTVADTAELTDRQLDTVGKAGFFSDWAIGESYSAGKRLFHDGVTYLVMQAVTAQAHQPPGSDGMLAIYRPVDPAAGTADDPKNLISGMDAVAGLYYRYDGVVWKCLRDLIPTFVGRLPGDAGMETFWERVNV